jgi:hypothetical protein
MQNETRDQRRQRLRREALALIGDEQQRERVRQNLEREDPSARGLRRALEAAFEFHAARAEIKGERDLRLAVERAADVATANASNKMVRQQIAKIAKREALKAEKQKERLDRRLFESQHRAVRPKAKLKQLRARAGRRAVNLPSPEKWKAIYGREVLHEFNRLKGPLARCEDCGKPFNRRNGKRYCSDECSARVRNRGRPKIENGKSPAESTRMRLEQRIRKHFERCPLCKSGKPCCDREAMMQTDDAMRFVNDVDPDVAEQISQRAGRTPKRSAEPVRRLRGRANRRLS